MLVGVYRLAGVCVSRQMCVYAGRFVYMLVCGRFVYMVAGVSVNWQVCV